MSYIVLKLKKRSIEWDMTCSCKSNGWIATINLKIFDSDGKSLSVALSCKMANKRNLSSKEIESILLESGSDDSEYNFSESENESSTDV